MESKELIEKILRDTIREILTKGDNSPLIRRSIFKNKTDELNALLLSQKEEMKKLVKKTKTDLLGNKKYYHRPPTYEDNSDFEHSCDGCELVGERMALDQFEDQLLTKLDKI